MPATDGAGRNGPGKEVLFFMHLCWFYIFTFVFSRWGGKRVVREGRVLRAGTGWVLVLDRAESGSPGSRHGMATWLTKVFFFTWAFPLKAYIDAAQCLRLGRAGGAEIGRASCRERV